MKHILLSLLVAFAVLSPAQAQKPPALPWPSRSPEPGATPGVELTNISNVPHAPVSVK